MIVLFEICLQVCVLRATVGCVEEAKKFMTLPSSHHHQIGGDFSPQAYTSHTIGSRKRSRQGRSSMKQESLDESVLCMSLLSV